MFLAAGAARGNYGDLDGRLDVADKLEVKAALGAVRVHAVEQDLAGAQRLAGPHELVGPEVPRLAAALDRALVPAVLLAVGPRPRRLERVVAHILRRPHIHLEGKEEEEEEEGEEEEKEEEEREREKKGRGERKEKKSITEK